MSCNTEYVIITSTNYMQYQCDDGNDEAERWPYITLYEAFLNDVQPEDAGAWLPMIKDALVFTIEEECGYFGACVASGIRLPRTTLPGSRQIRSWSPSTKPAELK